MAHFTRTQTTGTWTVGGAEGYVTLVSDWESLSEKVFKSINGDEGGTWAPSSPIVIDTSGMLVSVSTPVNYGGSLKTTAGARFVLGGGASDWPKLGASHVGRVRTIRADLLARLSTPRLHWCDSPTYTGSLQSIACTVNGASGLEQPKCAIPLRVHNGGRLVGATLTFRVSAPRTKVPVQMPKMRIVRTDADGNIVPMKNVATSAGGPIDGWVSMSRPTTGDAWYAGGAAQTFEYTCDINNLVDDSLYLYWAELQEEVGTTVILPMGAANDGAIVRERKAIVYHVFDGVVPLNPAFVNAGGNPGAGVADGDVVLITEFVDAPGSPLGCMNGIWVVNFAAVPWTRRADLASAVAFSNGFLVPDSSKWETWELVSPVFGETMKLYEPIINVFSGTPIKFQRRQPRGNIYHSLACHFDSIADMRPQ